MHELMEKVVKQATAVGIKAETFQTEKKNPLPQHFYNQVAKFKNNANPFDKLTKAAKSTPRPNKKGPKGKVIRKAPTKVN